MMRPRDSKDEGYTQLHTQTISASCDDVLKDADAVAISYQIQAGQISVREAVDAAIARAERVNPALNAISNPLFEAARRQADHKRHAGVFGGVPTFVKDSDFVVGSPRSFGSRALSTKPGRLDSAFVKQLLSLGVSILGTSTMSEFGLTASTETLAHGNTHNPWGVGYSPGGSSGGSASLVAAGVVPIAHGNDGGGSIRIPASCCGLVGLKPSCNRLVAMENSTLLPVKIIHQGILSRTVRDTATFLVGSQQYYRNPRLPVVTQVREPGRHLQIGFFTEYDPERPTHPECVNAVEDTAHLLESLGHAIKPVPPLFDKNFLEDFFLLWAAMAYSIARLGRWFIDPDFDRTKVEPFTAGLVDFFKENFHRLPMSIWRLKKFARQYADCFTQCDVIINPTVARLTPKIGEIGPNVPFETMLERMMHFVPFTPAQNVSGGPALSLPLAQSSAGLPIGIQLVAPLGQEQTLLALGLELETAAPWPTTPPVGGSN